MYGELRTPNSERPTLEAQLSALEQRLAAAAPEVRATLLRTAPERAELLALRDRVEAVFAGDAMGTDSEWLERRIAEQADCRREETRRATPYGHYLETLWCGSRVLGQAVCRTLRYSPDWRCQGDDGGIVRPYSEMPGSAA